MEKKPLKRSSQAFDPLLRRLRMRHFHLLALLDELGSLTDAAAALSLSQPAVSKMLFEIEDAFGSPLFERGRRGVYPTPSGHAAIRRARTMVGEISMVADEVRSIDLGARSLLQIGTFSVTSIVPRAIAGLMRRDSGVRVRIREGAITELLTLLLEGQLDCVFAAISPNVLAAGGASDLTWQNVIGDHLCALVSALHPLAGSVGGHLQWRDCAAARWVTMPSDTVVRQRFMEAFVREGLVPPLPVVETMSPITIAALVREDPDLIGLARYEIAEHSALLPGVRRLHLLPLMRLPPMCVITRRTQSEIPLVREFVECVKEAADRVSDRQHSLAVTGEEVDPCQRAL